MVTLGDWGSLGWESTSSAMCRDELKLGTVTKADLGVNVILETVFIPPRDFMMGSTPEENVGSRALKGGSTKSTTVRVGSTFQPSIFCRVRL